MTLQGDQRRQQYFQLSSKIAQLDNARLSSLFDANTLGTGWGRNHTLDLGGSKVFVKRLPITDIERDNLFSTNNLYTLPTYYNYGVGSAGFGVSRELVAHIKTTNWVLSGEIENFPLLYHYRVVPFSGERIEVDLERHNGYVAYWGGNDNIGRYMLDRVNASYELVLFLEYIPYVLQPWLEQHPSQAQRMLDDLRGTIDFLRKNEIIHFDAHFFNVLTDGTRTYLTDFGLVLDKNFTLSDDERALFDGNTHYDYGEIVWCLDYTMVHLYEALSEHDKRQMREKYGMSTENYDEMRSVFVRNIEAIHADGVLGLDEQYVDCVVKYRDIIILMYDFFSSLRANPKKDTLFPHTELRRLLNDTGLVADER